MTQLNSTSSWVASAGRYRHFADATQLDVEWSGVELSCVAIDTLTGSRRSELIGDSCSRCERVDNSTSSWVELRRRRYRHFADATQLNSLDVELSWVKLCCYKRAFTDWHSKIKIFCPHPHPMLTTFSPSPPHCPHLHSVSTAIILVPTKVQNYPTKSLPGVLHICDTRDRCWVLLWHPAFLGHSALRTLSSVEVDRWCSGVAWCDFPDSRGYRGITVFPITVSVSTVQAGGVWKEDKHPVYSSFTYAFADCAVELVHTVTWPAVFVFGYLCL